MVAERLDKSLLRLMVLSGGNSPNREEGVGVGRKRNKERKIDNGEYMEKNSEEKEREENKT